jgi:CBS domain-containing protein
MNALREPAAAHQDPHGAMAREVREVMTPGVVSVPADASLKQLYGALGAHGVHAVLVVERKSGAPLGWASAAGLLRWAVESGGHTAGQAVCEPIHTISPSANVREAVELLLQPGVSHLLVAHQHSALGEGVLSALDVVRLLSRR